MESAVTDASPLVCVHGFSGSWRNWVPITPALERHHRVYVARLAGHARGSAWPSGADITVNVLADQLERDLDAAALDRVHLVGNSLGGWLSLELAARGRALSATALSPALGWHSGGMHLRTLNLKLSVARAVFSAIAPYAETVLKPSLLRRCLLNGAMAHSERISVVEAAAFVRDNLRCSVYQELKDSFLQVEAELGAIDCPVQIGWPEKDALIPQHPYGVRFPALVPHAKVTALAGVGHVPMYDDPGLVAAMIVEFTTSVDEAHRQSHAAYCAVEV